MPDRTINFGESETEATYQIQDTDGAAGGGNFVIAKDTNADTVLLEYQPGSDTWQYAGDVDMGGGDITNVNGLTASSAIIGGTLTATDVNTDSVNTDSASVTNQLDSGSVNTERAIIGGGSVAKRIERETPSSDTGSFQFSGLSDDKEYRLFYSASVDSDEDVHLRFNGDGSSTGNYLYWDETGTPQTAQNEIQLFDVTAAAGVGGNVTFWDNRFGNDNRVAVNHRPNPGGPTGRIGGFAREGTRDGTGISSLTISVAGSGVFNGGQTVVELWERDYE